MQIKSLVLGPIRTNCYFVYDEETRKCLLIDPADDAQRIITLLERENLRPAAILLTHGHFDHIGAVNELVNKFRIPVIAGENEADLIADPVLNEAAAVKSDVTVVPDRLAKDGDVIDPGFCRFTVIYTPGHTKGSVCYYSEEEGVLFSGDTLFFESVGRTDLHTGNGDALIRSIKDRLFKLPGNTRVYPGHGPKTSIEYEIRNNPYL